MDYLDAVITVIGLSDRIGRTVIQKLIYFASQKGIVEDTYFPHYYGPYSKEVASALGTAVSIDFVQESTVDLPEYGGKRYVYTLTSSGEELYSMIKEEQAKDWEKLKQIVSICEKTAKLNMQVMACATKVHYILKQEKIEQGKDVMTSGEIKDMALRLGWHLSEEDINSATNLPVELDLVKEVNAERLDLRDLRNTGKGTWSKGNVQTYIDRERNEWER